MSDYNDWWESFLYSQGKLESPVRYVPFEHIQLLLKRKLGEVSKERIREHLKKTGRKNYPKFKNKLDKWCLLRSDLRERRVIPTEILDFLNISTEDLELELKKDQRRFLFALNGLPDYPDHYRLNHYLIPIKSNFPPYIKSWKEAADYMVLNRNKGINYTSGKFDLICNYGLFSVQANLKGYFCWFTYPKMEVRGKEVSFYGGGLPKEYEAYFGKFIF